MSQDWNTLLNRNEIVAIFEEIFSNLNISGTQWMKLCLLIDAFKKESSTIRGRDFHKCINRRIEAIVIKQLKSYKGGDLPNFLKDSLSLVRLIEILLSEYLDSCFQFPCDISIMISIPRLTGKAIARKVFCEEPRKDISEIIEKVNLDFGITTNRTYKESEKQTKKIWYHVLSESVELLESENDGQIIDVFLIYEELRRKNQIFTRCINRLVQKSQNVGMESIFLKNIDFIALKEPS